MRTGVRAAVVTAALALGAGACGSAGGGEATVLSTAPLRGGTASAGTGAPGSSSDGSGSSGAGAAAAGAAETHDVTVTGDVLPSLDGSTPDPGVGEVPPTLDGFAFDGAPLEIKPGASDHFQLVFFFAHWCPHCRAEVPRLVSWLGAGSKPANLDVYAVSTAVNRSPVNYPPSKWFAREGLTIPIMTDDRQSTAAVAWGLPGYPYAVLLSPAGKVVARVAGEFEGVPAFDSWVHISMASTPR